MSASIKEYLSQIPDLATQRALRPLFEAVYNDLVVVNANRIGFLYNSATWDAGSIADGDEEVKEVTVTGAALGDFVLVSSSIDVADLAITGAVTATNTVTCQLNNNTGGAIDLASATVYVVVIPKADVNAAMTAISNLTA